MGWEGVWREARGRVSKLRECELAFAFAFGVRTIAYDYEGRMEIKGQNTFRRHGACLVSCRNPGTSSPAPVGEPKENKKRDKRKGRDLGFVCACVGTGRGLAFLGLDVLIRAGLIKSSALAYFLLLPCLVLLPRLVFLCLAHVVQQSNGGRWNGKGRRNRKQGAATYVVSFPCVCVCVCFFLPRRFLFSFFLL